MVKQRLITRFALLVLMLGFARNSEAASAAGTAQKPLDYTRDIRPILADNCFTCHGPDENKRKGKLRLDLPEEAVKPGKSGKRAIVAGNVGESELLTRLVTKDEDELMPPTKTGKKLTQAQIDTLKRWIQEGAKSETHWSFVTPQRPATPITKNNQWAHNEIDRFVLSKLEEQNLKPSPEADRATLIRRATLDVTGLPPTPQEIDRFLSDKSPDAYEKLVDRLLESPNYGEHMAKYWLDAVRYADTHGYHIDSERSMWKYRDWLIDAYNSNKPFDAFTIEQIAGDLLPNATVDQKVATGYVRANMTTGEGGAIEEEYMAKYAFDRVETTGTVYLGLTMICARCHSHKYDAVTQREYYGLYALFNNLNEAVMDGNAPNPEPVLKVPTADQAKRLERLKADIEGALKHIEAPSAKLDGDQPAWEARWRQALQPGWTGLTASSAKSLSTNGPALTLEPSQLVVAPKLTANETFELRFPITATAIGGLKLELLAPKGVSEKSVVGVAEVEAELVSGMDRKATKVSFNYVFADAADKDRDAGRLNDGKTDTSWTSSVSSGEARSVVLVCPDPVKVPAGSELVVRLKIDDPAKNGSVQQFRISAATAEPLLGSLTPPRFTPWMMLGPLPSEDPKAVYNAVLEPEKGYQPTKGYPGVKDEAKWHSRGDIEDSRSNLLVQDLHGIHGVRYLHRTFNAPSAQSVGISLHADGWFKIWLNGTLVAERDHDEKPGEGALRTKLNLRAGQNELLVKVVTIQGASYFQFGVDPESKDTISPKVAAVLSAASSTPDAGKALVRDYYRRQHSDEYRATFQNLSQWKDEEAALDRVIPRTMVAREMDKSRDTFVLMRGEYDKRGDKVPPTTPAALSPWPAGAPTNRLGLAQWLVDPRHPLTPRVNANRIWQQYFGIGIVKTSDDFGVQGEAPSNPALMNWLACQFRDGGQLTVREGRKQTLRKVSAWNVKELTRLILTSSTYRQSSRISPELLARDPENRLMARGPRFRIDGEQVRDSALFASGLLVEKRGGRSVKPVEPSGLWEAVSFNNSQRYIPEPGEAQHRRSLYTFWKRQSPPPNMMIFDAPTREYCTVRRSRSNTPLQALVVLNDPHFVEASRALADRMLAEGGKSTRDRLRYGFRLVTSRQPKGDELTILENALKAQSAEYERDAESAKKLLTVGEYRTRATMPAPQLAAWTSVANVLLNLDEALTKN